MGSQLDLEDCLPSFGTRTNLDEGVEAVGHQPLHRFDPAHRRVHLPDETVPDLRSEVHRRGIHVAVQRHDEVVKIQPLEYLGCGQHLLGRKIAHTQAHIELVPGVIVENEQYLGTKGDGRFVRRGLSSYLI